MTGFKSGASDDDPLESSESSSETDSSPSAETTESQSPTFDEQELGRTVDSELETTSSTNELPWIFDRSSITDGREKTVQLHLQQSTLDAQRQTKSDVEAKLGETIKKADLREAAVIVGLQQMDELSEILEDWGYGR